MANNAGTVQVAIDHIKSTIIKKNDEYINAFLHKCQEYLEKQFTVVGNDTIKFEMYDIIDDFKKNFRELDVNDYFNITKSIEYTITRKKVIVHIFDDGLDNMEGTVIYRTCPESTIMKNIELAISWWKKYFGNCSAKASSHRCVGTEMPNVAIFLTKLREYLIRRLIKNGVASVCLETNYFPEKDLAKIVGEINKELGCNNCGLSWPYKFNMVITETKVKICGATQPTTIVDETNIDSTAIHVPIGEAMLAHLKSYDAKKFVC